MWEMIAGTLRALVYDRRGVSSLEYGILAVAIVGAVATATTVLSTDLTTLFNDIATAITNAVSKAAGGGASN
jgi:Flp pilus assembly pilin Flp